MDTIKIQARMRRGIVQLRHQFAQNGNGVFGDVLPVAEVTRLFAEESPCGRERHYSPLTTLRLFIGQVLSEDQACQDVVGRHLSERVAAGLAPSSLNTSAYCQARQRLPRTIPQQLCQMAGQQLEARMPSTWKWHGRRVVLFDGTTVSMPDTPDNQAAFPQSSEQKPGLGFPVARLGGLIGLASGAVVGYAIAPCSGKGSGEQSLLRDLLCLLQAGDVLVADALLATWWLVAGAVRRGADVVMAQHGSRHTDFTQGQRLGNGDHVVTWRKPPRPARMSQEEYRDWPESLSMREFEVRGRVLVTTLLDPNIAPPQELDALYGLRWNIEVDWRTIKVTMEMDVLRCRTPDMIAKEIGVHLLAYNLVRWSMATAAYLGEVLPRTLSFTGTKRLLSAFADELRHCGGKRLSLMFAIVLGNIASLKLPRRPGRVEPRAKKRRPKPLPLLNVPRQQARQEIRAKFAAWGLNLAT